MGYFGCKKKHKCKNLRYNTNFGQINISARMNIYTQKERFNPNTANTVGWKCKIRVRRNVGVKTYVIIPISVKSIFQQQWTDIRKKNRLNPNSVGWKCKERRIEIQSKWYKKICSFWVHLTTHITPTNLEAFKWSKRECHTRNPETGTPRSINHRAVISISIFNYNDISTHKNE